MQSPAKAESASLLAKPTGNIKDNDAELTEADKPEAKADKPAAITNELAANENLHAISPVFAATKYYAFKELDHMPAVLENINADPPDLLEYPQGGSLTIQLWVDEAGSVIKAEVVESDLPAQFSENATKAFLQVKFSPGLKDKLAVRAMAKVVVHYAPLNGRALTSN